MEGVEPRDTNSMGLGGVPDPVGYNNITLTYGGKHLSRPAFSPLLTVPPELVLDKRKGINEIYGKCEFKFHCKLGRFVQSYETCLE
jgi:hypothetical protein